MRGIEPWCPACEWRLGAFDPHRRPKPGDRLDHWLAFRLNRRRYTAFAGRPPGRYPGPLTRIALVLLALPLVLLGPVGLVYGFYLLFWGPALSPILGLMLMLVCGLILWPRRRPKRWSAWPVPPTDTPAFTALLTKVATAAGAPMPHEVQFDHRVNAVTTVHGLRRRRTLRIGLPLWAAIDEGQRIALLAHELGHFVNHDARSGPLVQAAHKALDTWLDVLGVTSKKGFWLLTPLLAAPALAFWLTSIALLVLDGRDSQRAEYLADRIALRVAGRDAIAQLLDLLLFVDRIVPAVEAGGLDRTDPRTWRTAAVLVQRRLPDIELGRQLSLRDQASLLASHPPHGLRSRMVRAQAEVGPAVVLDEQEWAAVDAELHPWMVKLRDRLVDTRR